MTRVSFFYANGTSYIWKNVLDIGFSVSLFGNFYVGNKEINPNTSQTNKVLAGLNGRTAYWSGGPQDDPFPSLLDPDIWDAQRVTYPAMAFPMGTSIDVGVANTIKLIRALPPGTPFCLGGYSQGAAVMSSVYNEIRSGSLTSRQDSFLGGVMFGNPRRQVDYRGSRGGTWSGQWDVPGSTTGGHGSFPSTAGNPYARLTNCDPLKWLDFAAPNDIFSSVGDTPIGLGWTAGNTAFLNLFQSEVLGYFNGMIQNISDGVQAAFSLAGQEMNLIDSLGTAFKAGGAGHVTYPWQPPVGNPEGNLTSYQIALDYLNKLADQWATASVILPNTTAGWSTTLIPPGS